jgi:DNA-directed RNA polymerase subunit K/omega
MSDLRTKLQHIDPNLQARNIADFTDRATNIYEALNIISKRAGFLSHELKVELNSKLEEFAVTPDRIEEILENKEQIEISKFYERLPNATVIATNEFINGLLDYEYRDEEGNVVED